MSNFAFATCFQCAYWTQNHDINPKGQLAIFSCHSLYYAANDRHSINIYFMGEEMPQICFFKHFKIEIYAYMENKTDLKGIPDMEISLKCIINLKLAGCKLWVNTQKNLQKNICCIVAPMVLKVSFLLSFFFLGGSGA